MPPQINQKEDVAPEEEPETDIVNFQEDLTQTKTTVDINEMRIKLNIPLSKAEHE